MLQHNDDNTDPNATTTTTTTPTTTHTKHSLLVPERQRAAPDEQSDMIRQYDVIHMW